MRVAQRDMVLCPPTQQRGLPRVETRGYVRCRQHNGRTASAWRRDATSAPDARIDSLRVNAVAGVLRLGIYRRFLAAAICTGVGVWIFQTAIYWAGLQSGSTATVGILVAVLSLPSLLLTIPAGVLTDLRSWARRRCRRAACPVSLVAFSRAGMTMRLEAMALR